MLENVFYRDQPQWVVLTRGAAIILILAGCGQPPPPPGTDDGGPRAQPAEHTDASPSEEPPPAPAEPVDPDHLVLAFRNGQWQEMDDRRAAGAGLTVLDLRDNWAPAVLRGTTELPSTYEEVYVGLANEQGDPVEQANPETANYYLEVYGISPSFSTMKRRLDHEEQTKCFAELDYETLGSFEGFLAYRSTGNLKAKAASFRALEKRIKRLMKEQSVERPEDIEGDRNRVFVRQYQKLAPRTLVLRAAQQRLACEKLFPSRRHVADAFDWSTHIGLLNFERRHRLYGWGYLNQATAKALSWNPQETAYHTIRRAVGERLVDAAGIIEDGSVNGRDGKAPTYTGEDGQEHPVRNLVEEMTQAAMEHLGITGAEQAAAFLREHDFSTLRVALPLPELPEYYSDHMELFVRIDRGDIWYDYPYDAEGNEIPQPVSRRPTTNLYVRYLGKTIHLARFGTTVGGWRSEVIDGVEHWAYKNSDVGDRVWRHVVGAPSWIPPESTPTRDLVTKRRSRYVANYAETGPGYASAYGLVMGIHVRAVKRQDDTMVFIDNGIRSHGSVNYQSIQKRHSHGCHRLHNHLALRLFTFVLKRRTHTRLGQEQISAGRTFHYKGQTVVMRINTRGYRFELEPPLPLTVTEGRILGRRRTPSPPVIKPEEVERLRLEALEAGQADGGPVQADGGPGVPQAAPLPAPAPAPAPADG